jgi:hypothetical protein
VKSNGIFSPSNNSCSTRFNDAGLLLAPTDVTAAALEADTPLDTLLEVLEVLDEEVLEAVLPPPIASTSSCHLIPENNTDANPFVNGIDIGDKTPV